MNRTTGSMIRHIDRQTNLHAPRSGGVFINHALPGEAPWQAHQRGKLANPGRAVATFVGFAEAA
jgi:hypothetical protein